MPETSQSSLPIGKKTNFKQALKHRDKLLGRIEAAHAAGKTKLTAAMMRQYLQSFAARYVAVVIAARKMRPYCRPLPDTWSEIAKSLNPWQGTTEAVFLSLKQKKDNHNQFRTILDFGIENRALHQLLLPVLEIQADLHPSQYGTVGTHAAILRVQELMKEGYTWAVEIDIKNCYPSFDGEKVADLLPLPKAVTANVIIAKSLSMEISPAYSVDRVGSSTDKVDDILYGDELAAARQGIPQGSAISPLVAEMLLASLCKSLPACGQWVVYADNFLAMAKSEKDVADMTSALWSALQAHPAGPLGSKAPKIFEPGSPVELLGHRLSVSGDDIQIEASTNNVDKFLHVAHHKLARLKGQKLSFADRLKRAKELRAWAKGWFGSFKYCPNIKIHIEHTINYTYNTK